MSKRGDIYLRRDIERAWGDDPFAKARAQQGEIFRDKENRRTLRFQLAERGYFLKLHQGVGWLEIFKNLLHLRLPVIGASNEYAAIRCLEKVGVDTLSVAGYGKRGRNPARQLSFLVTDELQQVESLEDFCARWPQQPPGYTQKRVLIGKVATLSRTLHDQGMNHRDYYLCHLLLDVREPVTAANIRAKKLYVMDLHRAQIRRRVPRRWLVKDLGALYYSALEIGLTQRDVLRFIRVYSGLPLNQTLRADSGLWRAVRMRAAKIYRRDFGREPVFPL
ncbi:MAG: lipopolysaccharide core heptose(I) kinase RfaP [Spongiibacteraceae bacterium]